MAGRVEVHLAPQGRETLAAYRPPAKRNRRHRSVSYGRKLRMIVSKAGATSVTTQRLHERTSDSPRSGVSLRVVIEAVAVPRACCGCSSRVVHTRLPIFPVVSR